MQNSHSRRPSSIANSSLLAYALAALMLLAPGSIEAQEGETADGQPAQSGKISVANTHIAARALFFPLVINEKQNGAIRATPPDAEGLLHMSVVDLVGALSGMITTEVQQSLDKLPANEGFVAAIDMRPLGIHAEFDEQELVIRLYIDLDARPVGRLAAGP